MAIKVSLVSSKGGVGKSTISMMLISALYHYYHFKVMLIDVDGEQVSIYKSRAADLKAITTDTGYRKAFERVYENGKEPFPIIKADFTTCAKKVDIFEEDYDIIFIDAGCNLTKAGSVTFFQTVNYRVSSPKRIIEFIELYEGKVDFLEQFVYHHRVYETTYRNTLLPFPKEKKEAIKFFAFADCFLATIGLNRPLLNERGNLSSTNISSL